MAQPWALVVPASRGIGYHLTRTLLQRTDLPILATARSDPETTRAKLLQDLHLPSSSSSSPSRPFPAVPHVSQAASRLHVAQLDVTDEATVQAAADRCAHHLFPSSTHHLRLAFALPGVLHVEKRVEAVDYDAALDSFRVNVLGPLLLMKHFARFLPRRRHRSFDSSSSSSSSSPSSSLSSKKKKSQSEIGEETQAGERGQGQKQHREDEEGRGQGRSSSSLALLPDIAVWTNMSARVGSIADNRLGGWYSYRASKAAVNSLTRCFDLQLLSATAGAGASGSSAMAMAYHPGTVATDFTREYRAGVETLLEPEFAAERMLDVVLRCAGDSEGTRGRCWDWKGEEVPP